eukprot:2787898-Pleurochrysis_carterae.AAC.1
MTLCVRLRSTRTTRAADSLARAARGQPCACTCAVHAQPERPKRLRAPLGDNPVLALARCTHNPSGRSACARRSVTTRCVHLRGARTTQAADALARAVR